MSTPPRRRFAFRLRTLFVVVFVASIPLAWIGYSLDWKNRESRRIVKALDEPTTFAFIEEDLLEILVYLKTTHHIEIQITHGAFPEQHSEGITCEAANIKLSEALERILKPRKLAYEVVDGVLLIVTEGEQSKRHAPKDNHAGQQH